MTRGRASFYGGGSRTVAALGQLDRLPVRRIVVRGAVLVALLAVALVVRATGILHPDDTQSVPPLPEAATVLPNVWRSATPTETETVLLRDTFGVRALVSVGQPTIEEQAVAPALGLRLLTLDVGDDAAPSAAQLTQLRDFVRSAGAGVLLHDGSGTGPVVATAAMLQLLDGQPLTSVLAGASNLTAAQTTALRDLDAALAGRADPANPYRTLTR